MLGVDQVLTLRDYVLQPVAVRRYFGLESRVLLDLVLQIRRVGVVFVAGHLNLLAQPRIEFVQVSQELLECAGFFQAFPASCRRIEKVVLAFDDGLQAFGCLGIVIAGVLENFSRTLKQDSDHLHESKYELVEFKNKKGKRKRQENKKTKSSENIITQNSCKQTKENEGKEHTIWRLAMGNASVLNGKEYELIQKFNMVKLDILVISKTKRKGSEEVEFEDELLMIHSEVIEKRKSRLHNSK